MTGIAGGATAARIRKQLRACRDQLDVLRRIREFAKGRPCQFRVPGICNGNPETSVWAHVPRGGIAGMGQKAPDICGGIACSDCHDYIDGRSSRLPATECHRDTLILDGVLRSQALVWKEAGLDV